MSAEPSPRQGHFSAAVGDQLYMWGGYTKDLKNAPASALHSFHPVLESWEHCECSGPPPPALYNGACASTGGNFYFYGGRDGSDYQGCLYQLDIKSRKWQQLSSAGPMSKAGCGMIAYGKKLVVIGGYGIPFATTQHGAAEFVKDSNYTNTDSGWTNELHTFDLEEGEVPKHCHIAPLQVSCLVSSCCMHRSMCFRHLRKREASSYHVQLCVAMLCMMLVFVVGIEETRLYAGCAAVSVLLHYFTLVAVSWMTAEAVLMFKKLAFVFKKTTKSFILKTSLICWSK